MNGNWYIEQEMPDVTRAARLLDISEFELFGAAYRSWYGESAGERYLESHFVPYMFEGTVPFWVRHFTRETLEARNASASPGTACNDARGHHWLDALPTLLTPWPPGPAPTDHGAYICA